MLWKRRAERGQQKIKNKNDEVCRIIRSEAKQVGGARCGRAAGSFLIITGAVVIWSGGRARGE